jgi:integrase
MCGNDTKAIEKKIIEFIMRLRDKGLSHSACRNYMMAIISFYKIHDIILNTAKISSFLPEYKRIRKDRGYEHEEIQKLLDIADERMRAVILILASTGMRIGALTELKVRDVQDNKITVYDGYKEEYPAFDTPECKTAIDSYLDMRSRYGEKLSDDSPLIREQFDVRVSSSKARHVDESSLYGKLRDLSRRSGVRTKEVAISKGFRKFFMNQCVNCKMNPEIREMLLGHKIGLASAYYRPTEEEMFNEYQKVVNNLTINQENRLKAKVETLEREKTNYDFLNERMDEMQKNWVQIFDMIYKNKTPEQIKEMQESYERTIGKLDFTILQKNDK